MILISLFLFTCFISFLMPWKKSFFLFDALKFMWDSVCMITKTKPNSQSIIDLLINYNGHSFVGLTTLTDARAKKTNNPYGKILKKTILLANIGFHYSNSLDNQAKREGKEIDFNIQPRRWGVRLPNTPLVEHKGKYYLEYKSEKVTSVEYFTENGEQIEKEKIEEFLPQKRHSSTQKELDKKIILRDVAIENILSLRISKNVYLG